MTQIDSMVLHTEDGDVKLAQETSPLPETKMKLAYVKHNFIRFGFENIKYFPDVIPMQDRNFGDQKGRTIAVRAAWWKYIQKINSPKGYEYARSIGAMWINAGYDLHTPYSTGLAESVHCGGNFLQYTDESSTHVKVVAWDNFLTADQELNPEVHNWHNMPHRFWKACAVERNGTKVINVNAGDVYFPLLCNHAQFGLPAELWMKKSNLELLEENYYTFKDGDVYLDGELFYETGVVRPVV